MAGPVLLSFIRQRKVSECLSTAPLGRKAKRLHMLQVLAFSKLRAGVPPVHPCTYLSAVAELASEVRSARRLH